MSFIRRPVAADPSADTPERRQQRGNAGGMAYIAGGLVGFFTVPLVEDPAFRAGPVALASALAILAGIALILRARSLSLKRQFISNLIGPLLIGVAAYFAGPEVSGYVAMLWVWTATLAFFFFPAARALIVVVLVGISYAVVLVLQDVGTFGLVRWVITMTTIVVTGGLVAWLIQRTLVLRENARIAEETALRARAELEVEQLRRLRDFVPTEVADLISHEDAALLEPHRREIAVFFIDMRGFTAFTSMAEPEDAARVLESFYETCITVSRDHKATIGDIAGDGLMAYFNDPIECEDPVGEAVRMAAQISERLSRLEEKWNLHGHEIGHGVGIALGYATIGMLGPPQYRRYGPVGTVVHIAARLCAEATAGETLIDQRARAELRDDVPIGPSRSFQLKGIPRPVIAHTIGTANRERVDDPTSGLLET